MIVAGNLCSVISATTGSALNANLHFHVVVPDGIFDEDGVFHRLPNPTDDDVEQVP